MHCWKARHEALGYERITDAILELPHADLERWCREDGREPVADPVHGDEPWIVDTLSAVCLREDGHAGPCAFTPTDEIAVTFAPAAAP